MSGGCSGGLVSCKTIPGRHDRRFDALQKSKAHCFRNILMMSLYDVTTVQQPKLLAAGHRREKALAGGGEKQKLPPLFEGVAPEKQQVLARLYTFSRH